MKELILRYFDAFANLYGIIPIKRAYRIIEKQNPELNLTKEQFAEIVNEFDFPDKYYVKRIINYGCKNRIWLCIGACNRKVV